MTTTIHLEFEGKAARLPLQSPKRTKVPSAVQRRTAAGAVNVGAAVAGRADFDLERLLQLRPEVLMRGAAYAATPSVRGEAVNHPVLRKLYAGAQLTYPEAVYGCGVPRAAQMALQLRQQLAAVRTRRNLP